MKQTTKRVFLWTLVAVVILGLTGLFIVRPWPDFKQAKPLDGDNYGMPTVETGAPAPESPAAELPTAEPPAAELPTAEPPATVGGESPKLVQMVGQLVAVLYATNRIVTASTNEVIPAQVTPLRSSNLSFGLATVRIPEKHDLGVVEQPKVLTLMGFTLWKEKLNEKEHFVLSGIRPFTIQDFKNVAGADKDRSALIYVHGFNTDFVGAIFKLAQIVFDTKYKGLPVAFIWPSRGGLANYDADHEGALASRGSFRHLLNILYKDAGLKKIHVMAHSMGNQVVIEALNQLGLMKEDIRLSELILAAPDVDQDGFSAVAPTIRTVVDGMTIYVSSADKALRLSKFKAGRRPRLGDSSASGPAVFAGIDTIDVTALGEDVFELNHSLFSSARSAIDDIGRILQGRAAAWDTDTAA